MPINRYGFTRNVINTNEMYNDFFKSKNIKSIDHLVTKKYRDIEKESEQFSIASHVCQYSDKLTTLATKYYGNPRYWYLIALSNKIPNDFFLEPGLELNIYFPLEKVVSFFNGN
jgi:nucleoid-associated protein YgaU